MSLRDLFCRTRPHPDANTWAIKLERNDTGDGNLYRLVHIAWDENCDRTETILRPAPNPDDPKEFWA